ncbi:glycosyltransferase family 2 protein [Bisgaard Taxon 10/6]|uniref:glycosyltransferase family 2 protein n=1 Tax=Exercitatus varius TaxID=67857 RepID=UPI00294B8FB6|nr:glycosyltransferase family 2 protein [Exercitatus varius]MDG2956250.1 glycosyltransferase family 2 protein [Exercitatus varius]MDG2964370.1 glycosyltransferase family 2 protein [Exercitatus varius]
MNRKVLSIVVPSYNAGLYLPETIPTMLSISNLDKLEVIIVNDGSQDNTLAIASKLKSDYSDTIVIVDKENGGHGSTINAGIKVATGKYFKVVDADDWVNTENLSLLIDYLSTIDDDEVISPFVKVYTDTKREDVYSYNVSKSRATYNYESFLSEINELPKMHAITIKTNILRDNQIHIDENCFYVDLEYNTFPMPYIKTISYFDKPVYRYRLGSPTQSVSMASYIKNVKMHKTVIFALIRFYNQYEKATAIEKRLLESLIEEIITIHTNIHLSMKDVETSKKEFLSFEHEILSRNKLFSENSLGKKLKILRATNYLTFGLMSFLNRHFIQKN